MVEYDVTKYAEDGSIRSEQPFLTYILLRLFVLCSMQDCSGIEAICLHI
jgi:hypothetical protein